MDVHRVERLDRLEAEVTYGLMQALGIVVGDDDDAFGQVATAAQQVAEEAGLALRHLGAVGRYLVDDEQIHLFQGAAVLVALLLILDDVEEEPVHDGGPLLEDHRFLMARDQLVGYGARQGGLAGAVVAIDEHAAAAALLPVLEAADEVAGRFDGILQGGVARIHLVEDPVRIEIRLGDQLLDPLLARRLLQLAYLGVGLGVILLAQGLVVVLAAAGCGPQPKNTFLQAVDVALELGIVSLLLLLGLGDPLALGFDLFQCLAQRVVRICHGMLLLLGLWLDGQGVNSALRGRLVSIILGLLSLCQPFGFIDHLLRPAARTRLDGGWRDLLVPRDHGRRAAGVAPTLEGANELQHPLVLGVEYLGAAQPVGDELPEILLAVAGIDHAAQAGEGG